MFISQIHRHSSFNPDLVLKPTHENYNVFMKIGSIVMSKIPVTDTSTHIYFLNLLTEMKVEGIKSVKFTNDFTENHEVLYRCNFPDKFIPDEYLCLISSQIMDEPCYDKRTPDQLFDKNKVSKSIEETGKNPFNKQPITVNELQINTTLKNKIINFRRKVTLIPCTFPETYNEKYVEYKEQICGTCSFEEFNEYIQQKNNTNKPSVSDQTSIKALVDKENNSNPLKLYESGLKHYQNKKFDSAISQINQALELFESKNGEHLLACFKCYSTLISCYRDNKQFTHAIECAEKAIPIFYGKKIDTFDNLIKKYHECLKLNDTNSRALYNQALTHYKANKFSLALYKLLYVQNALDVSNKSELASCHSTLASCYRELKLYDKAINHCEKTLELRKSFLEKGDPLIKEAEKKLEAIQKLALNNQKETSEFKK